MATKTNTKKATPTKTDSRPTWSDEQVELLKREVAAGPSAKAAFGRVAAAIGKSEGTVQQKWYNMQKKASGSKPSRSRGRAGARTAAAAHPAPSRPARASGNGSFDVSVMEGEALVKLAQDVRAEIDRRAQLLSEASRVLSGSAT